jgi:hypothetical protein
MWSITAEEIDTSVAGAVKRIEMLQKQQSTLKVAILNTLGTELLHLTLVKLRQKIWLTRRALLCNSAIQMIQTAIQVYLIEASRGLFLF